MGMAFGREWVRDGAVVVYNWLCVGEVRASETGFKMPLFCLSDNTVVCKYLHF